MVKRLMVWRANPVVAKLLTTSAIAAFVKFIGVGLQFLVFVYCARVLTQYQYGILAAGFSLAVICASFAVAGQQFSVLRFLPKASELDGVRQANKVVFWSLRCVGNASGFLLICGALASVVGINIGALGESKLIWLVIAILGISMAVGEFFSSVLRARGLTLLALVPMDIAWKLLFPVVSLVFVIKTGLVNLFLMALVLLLVVALQLIIAVKATQDAGGLYEAALPSKAITDEMENAKSGLWMISFANALTQNIITVVLTLVLGPVDAALFFSASKLSNLMTLILVGVNQVVGPMISKFWVLKDFVQVRRIYVTSTLISIAGGLVFFFVYLFFGSDILMLFGKDYEAGYRLLIILAAGQLVNIICGPNRAMMMMIGLEKQLLFIVSTTAIVVTLAAAYFSSNYGSTGAAFASAVGAAILNLGALLVLAYQPAFRK